METPDLTAGAGTGKQVIPHRHDHVIVVVQQDIPPFLDLRSACSKLPRQGGAGKRILIKAPSLGLAWYIKVVYASRMRLTIAFILLLLAGCSRSNNLLMGRVEATVGTHTVVVTDCYRTTVPPPELLANGDHHFMPCRDADVWIRGEELTVNGTGLPMRL